MGVKILQIQLIVWFILIVK